ncbi:hypothetical protein I4200191B4_17240 [Pseudoflavonifractor gallinarum]|uniref:ABC transporter permease n=1 Tax=Pseudoflavonifractor TaxID=1017280 RepID=UPI001C037FA4|nr:ABC transporter permease [Pseudoflavonifractor sp. MCC625]MBT9683239.1 ABC transporter permease [Pseudoflavonifractor sp. MCC625]
MTAIYQRELRAYFTSMTGYVFLAALVFFTGIYFMAYNLFNGFPRFSYALMSLTTILMFTIPILTMRSMAEDRRSRTDQLLLTAPVSLTGVVMGKYLAMVTVFFFPVFLAAFCPLIIAAHGASFLASDYASLLAFFLMGCTFLAIGMFLSALTESQIIAAVGTFVLLLLLFLWDDLTGFLPGVLGEVLSAFSFTQAFYNFALYDVFDLGGLVLYLSMAALFVFLTIQTLQKRRWS